MVLQMQENPAELSACCVLCCLSSAGGLALALGQSISSASSSILADRLDCC